jgi:hypothetical protein
MKIMIKGASWQKHVMLHAAGVYFAKKLGMLNKKRTKVVVELVPGMQARLKCRGEAHQNSKKSFRIKLDSALKPMSLVKCLAHEMIHVHQWVSGQMEDLCWTRYRVKWGKRIYYPAKLAYRKHPWEIQAHKFEDSLYKSFAMAWDAR